MVTTAARSFYLKKAHLFPIQCCWVMRASGGGRQLLRAVPFPKAQCADTIPRVPDNINAKQLSLN